MAAEPTLGALIHAVKRMHAAKGRYHSQHATCDLYDLLGLPCVRETIAPPAALASAPAAETGISASAEAGRLWELVEAYAAARVAAVDPANRLAAVEAAHGRMLRLEVTLRQAFAAQASHPQAQVMVDCTPPATSREKWFYEQGRLAERDPRTHAAEAQVADPISGLVAAHQKMLDDGNHYAYFELAYTRQTEWMAWLCSKPREDDPNRKVLACGQGETPAEACAAALQDQQERLAAVPPPEQEGTTGA